MSTQDQEAPDVNEEPATLPVDPKETEKAGKKLAQALGSQSISVVVCWDKAEDAVLAHVVARELGVPVCYAYESGGIMGLESRLPAGASTALVSDVFRHQNDLAGLAGVVTNSGYTVAAVATRRPGVSAEDTTAAKAISLVYLGR